MPELSPLLELCPPPSPPPPPLSLGNWGRRQLNFVVPATKCDRRRGRLWDIDGIANGESFRSRNLFGYSGSFRLQRDAEFCTRWSTMSVNESSHETRNLVLPLAWMTVARNANGTYVQLSRNTATPTEFRRLRDSVRDAALAAWTYPELGFGFVVNLDVLLVCL